jgi:hypothetical protein
MQLPQSGYGVGCQVPKPIYNISFQVLYKEIYENLFMLNKEDISEMFKCCDVFITISGVTSTKLWKGFQYPLGKS